MSSPLPSPITTYLHELHARLGAVRDGAVATYIPELAKADPAWFGICLATTDGQLYEVGDTRQPFTIQSISKPFAYGLALEDVGRPAVLAKVGVEPTGDAFNSISLAPGTGRPLNPMINAGAIATSGLVAGRSREDRLERLLAVFALYAGRPLAVDDLVYRSERETGHRNRAIGHMLRNFDVLTEDPDEALDLYFRQCSIAVDCRDLAVMAATLANGGENPRTGERAVRREYVESMLSVMTTCGMYDFAGEWVYAVGLPAKSGVAGGVLAVLPGRLGIGVFSPPLDARGNSVRGVAACRELSRDFGLHFLDVPRPAPSTLRTSYTLGSVRSKRLRPERERAMLDTTGDRVHVHALEGDVGFAGLEPVVRRIVQTGAEARAVLVDLRRVTAIEPCVARLLLPLVVDLGERGTRLALVGADAHPAFLRTLEESLATVEQWGRLRRFADVDDALEWGEGLLLYDAHDESESIERVALADHELCRGLDAAALATLAARLVERRFEAGQTILARGDAADAMFLLASGQVSIRVEPPGGRPYRLSTVSPGMVFGELAVIDRSGRTADARADTAVECWVLSSDALDRLGTTHPTIKVRILENLLRNVHQTVGRLNRELAARAR